MTEVAKKVTNPIREFFSRPEVIKRFNEVMGDRAGTFTASVLTISNQNDKLKKCSPESIYACAMMAASLNLQIHPSLGEAYIIPYGEQAQFQIGWKGMVQLALRSGQFNTISVTPVYEGQIIEEDPLKGFVFDWSKKASEKVVGYAAFFSLLNGFEKTFYMTVEAVTKHGSKFSKTYNSGPWKTDFDAMAMKTVLKLLISRFAPRSVDMQKAVIVDQAVIRDSETLDVEYVDEGGATITKEMLSEMLEAKKESLKPSEYERMKAIMDTEEVASYQKVYEALK